MRVRPILGERDQRINAMLGIVSCPLTASPAWTFVPLSVFFLFFSFRSYSFAVLFRSDQSNNDWGFKMIAAACVAAPEEVDQDKNEVRKSTDAQHPPSDDTCSGKPLSLVFSVHGEMWGARGCGCWARTWVFAVRWQGREVWPGHVINAAASFFFCLMQQQQ